MVKEFQFFLEKGEVKKQSPDLNLSKATLNEGMERLDFAKSILPFSKPKYILENAYEAMREGADSILYREGYKSFSHEASIVYLLKKGFSTQDILEFDRFRKIRNSIKYYGKDCEKEDALLSLKLAEKILAKIKDLAR